MSECSNWSLTLHYKRFTEGKKATVDAQAHKVQICFSTFLTDVNRVVALQHKQQNKTCKKLGSWKREWVVEFQLSDSIWSSFSFSSLCLNLNEMSDFEAVAKLLKVCQWVFASELKDTLRLAEQRGQRGPQHPAGQRRHCCTGVRVCVCVCACMFVCVCVCTGTTKRRLAKGHHLHYFATEQGQRPKPAALRPARPKSTQQQRWRV